MDEPRYMRSVYGAVLIGALSAGAFWLDARIDAAPGSPPDLDPAWINRELDIITEGLDFRTSEMTCDELRNGAFRAMHFRIIGDDPDLRDFRSVLRVAEVERTQAVWTATVRAGYLQGRFEGTQAIGFAGAFADRVQASCLS